MNIKNGKYIKCKICQKSFYIRPCEYKTKKYCSRNCKHKALAIRYKGKNGPRYHKKHTAETIAKIKKSLIGYNATSHYPKGKYVGEKSNSWKGGKYIGSSGYIYVYSPNHPNKTKLGYVLESRLVMEKHIGRFLKYGEIVHHINEIKSDNSINNLMLFPTISAHVKFHHKINTYK